MKQPWVYMCSTSRSPLPPPSPPAPSRSSQCTRSERLSHASKYFPPEILLYEIIYLLLKPPVNWLIFYFQSQSIPAYMSLRILSIWKRVWLVNSGCCVCLWVETRQSKEPLRSYRFINMKPSTLIRFPLRCCGEEEEEKQAEYPKVTNVPDIYILYPWCFINRNIAEFMISTKQTG